MHRARRPSSKRLSSRNSRTRAVIDAPSKGSTGRNWRQIAIRAEHAAPPASADEETARRRAVETRTKRGCVTRRCCLGLERGNPVPHGRQGLNKPLRCRPLEGRRDQRSPLRRCFKPRPPLSAGCAGFASGCRSSGSELKRSQHEPLLSRSGRLSGLLSGCPPTDTRPQARAKLGTGKIIDFAQSRKHFSARHERRAR